MRSTRRAFVVALLAYFATVAFGQTDTECDEQCVADAMLNKGSLALCPAKCGTYRAGADTSNLMVCQYFGSGRGSITQRSTDGATCMPAYNCRDDWNLCVQWNNNTASATIFDQDGLASDAPYANVGNATAMRAACEDITSLATQTTGSATPPSGGWAPTSLGWHKGEGNIGCGYGSTYGGTVPDGFDGDDLELTDYGRVEISGISDVVDCCVKAMEYEGATMAQGGKAVRFDVLNNVCRIDREMMMKGNLDSSTGFSMAYIVPCGDDDEFFYWRHAAGNADGASLGSAGSCAARFNFTKVTSSENFLPMARLPQLGIEVPNHIGICNDPAHAEYDVEQCQFGVQYNSISDPEQCCEACESLKWLPSGDAQDTPCVAFQIVHGRCQIVREKHFTDRYGAAGLGRYSGVGNGALSVTQAMELCATANLECERADDSHGHWGSCTEGASDTPDMCEYYSFLYYRDRLAATNEFPEENANATKPSYVSFDVFEPAELSGGMNITINATLVELRTNKNLTGALESDAADSSAYNLTRAANNTGYNDTNPACVRIRLYASDPDEGTAFLDSVGDNGTYSMDPENATVTKDIVAESALCCPSADGGGCELELSFTEEEANNETSGVGRRLLAAASEGKRFVVAYECEGTGGDVCDLQRTGYDVPNIGASPPAADEFAEVAGVGTDDDDDDDVLVVVDDDDDDDVLDPVDDDAVSAAAATAASLALASVVALSALA